MFLPFVSMLMGFILHYFAFIAGFATDIRVYSDYILNRNRTDMQVERCVDSLSRAVSRHIEYFLTIPDPYSSSFLNSSASTQVFAAAAANILSIDRLDYVPRCNIGFISRKSASEFDYALTTISQDAPIVFGDTVLSFYISISDDGDNNDGNDGESNDNDDTDTDTRPSYVGADTVSSHNYLPRSLYVNYVINTAGYVKQIFITN